MRRMQPFQRAFTIVELLVVVVVIGILAGIISLTYRGMQRSAEETAMKTELTQVNGTAKVARSNNNNRYPETTPRGVAPNVANSVVRPFNYYQRDGGRSYCAEIQSVRFNDLAFHIDSATGVIGDGHCKEGTPTRRDCFTTTSTQLNIDGQTISGLRVTGYRNDCPKDLVIPAAIGGNPIVEIGEYVFREKNLVSVRIPKTVRVIQAGAFKNNVFTSIDFSPNLYEIGFEAFRDNHLEKVHILSTTKHIKSTAFGNNTKMREVTFEEGVEEIGDFVFRDSKLLSEVRFPKTLKTIGEAAFDNCGLHTVDLPDGVVSIGKHAFRNNQVVEVDFPASLRTIGESAFHDNHLASVHFPEGLEQIGDHAFRSNKLVDIRIPRTVKYIGREAFRYQYYVPGVSTKNITCHVPNSTQLYDAGGGNRPCEIIVRY